VNMVNAYIENSYKLVFPLMCNGYLNLDYNMAITQGATAVESSGVLVNATYTSNASTTIAVDTVDATTKFEVGDTVFDATGTGEVGIVSAITATQITLEAINAVALANNENLKKHVTTSGVTRNRGIWAHDDSFTLEAIITPYDVNGIGSRTAGRHGILTSAKTPPYPSDDYSNPVRATYESVNYLGTSNYLTQKMMLFHNTNLKLYLENTTSATGSSYNQPAEYKIVAKLTEDGTTETIETALPVITAENTLFGYYDDSGYYSNNATSHQLISASASNAYPASDITISSTSLPTNTPATAATGTVSITGDGDVTNYASALSATATIDIGGSGSDYTVPADTGQSAGTGNIVIKSVPSQVDVADKDTDFISLDNNTTTYYLYPRSSGGNNANGGILAGQLGWNANSYMFLIDGTVNGTAGNLIASINAINGLSAGIIASQPLTNDTVDLLTQQATAIWNGGITLGSGYDGNDFAITDITGGDAGTEVNSYITITNTAGTAKNYKATDFNGTATGSTGTTNNGSVNVVFYKNGSSLNGTANTLKAAIEHSNGHNGTITVSTTNNPLTLTQATTGTAGNNTISLTGLGSSDVVVTGFANGTNVVNGSSTPYIELIDAAGSAVTRRYVPVANGDVIATGSNNNGSIGSVSGGIAFQEGASATATATNLKSAIEHTNGHDGSITVSRSSGVLTLTQGTTGTAGNTTITLSNTSKTTRSSFTGGANITSPNAYISITDAAGENRKYHASTTEATGYDDDTYIYFRNGGDTDASAANLKTAIEHEDGHDGSLTVSRADNMLTVNTTTNGGQEASALNNISSGVTLGSWSTQTNQISVGANEASEIGTGNKIYDSSTTLIGTVSSSSNSVITLAENPATTVTSTIYTDQLKEALYLEQTYKIALVFLKGGSVELWLNNALLKKQSHSLNSLTLHPSDCKIGRGASNAEQFFGELYEISMHKGKQPCATTHTLTPSYSNILFYYTFGDT